MVTARSDHSPPRLHRLGFSLIELAVVAAVIGILAALALPYFKRVRDRSAINTFEQDLRVFVQEFNTFELQNGFFPVSQNTPGVFPIGMDGRLSDAWKLPCPIGGTYTWVLTTEDDASERNAYIRVSSTEIPFIIDAAQLAQIDRDLDDGDPSSGKLQLNGPNLRYYLR